MRFIPTFDQKVEQLKLQAKKLQRKGGGKHAALLDRVARTAGYDHWHHVVECNKQTTSKKGADALIAECAAIAEAERRGEVKVVMTGPEVDSAIGPFVLFSTGTGDAWMLDPEENLCLPVMFRGEPSDVQISENPRQLQIGWEGTYELVGHFMHVKPFDERIKPLAVGGYPLEAVRSLIDRAQSFSRRFATLFGQEDALELTDLVIADLVRQGWDESEVRRYAVEGMRYSPSRNSMLGPLMSSEDDLDGTHSESEEDSPRR